MNRSEELHRAKGAYRWLLLSPLLTIPTLILINSFDLGSVLIFAGWSTSHYILDYNDAQSLGMAISVLGSALWHLILLQYVSHRDSAFIRKQGKQALIQAGIRTAIALVSVGANWFYNSEFFTFLAIGALFIFWLFARARLKDLTEEEKRLRRPKNAAEAPDAVFLPFEQPMGAAEVRLEDLPASAQLSASLAELYPKLQSADESVVLQAIATLMSLNESEPIVRARLEQLAAGGASAEIRARALSALDTAANRALQQNLTAQGLERNIREVILHEIGQWTQAGLLGKQSAEVIRRRYDFDSTPLPAAQPEPAPPADAQPATSPDAQPQPTAGPPPQAAPVAPPQPSATLLQTLTSEGAIKIYLYLGAFFVVAAAAILAAIVPELRLPVLVVGSFLFGGSALVIKKRLPQPSFALFIVFSFLVLITAGSLGATLRAYFNLSSSSMHAYWAVVFIFMALLWIGSTWLYSAYFFSMAALVALALASFRLGNLFDLGPTLHTLLIEFTALLGLAGVWLQRRWKGDSFALPLFLTAQTLQAMNLAAMFVILLWTSLIPDADPHLRQLVTLAAWTLGAVFYLGSDRLLPFFAFRWLLAAVLMLLPWFIIVAFDFKIPAWSLALFLWSVILAVISEWLARVEQLKKYSLPVLLAFLINLGLGISIGYFDEIWLGLLLALGGSLLLTVLHALRNRGLLWALALLSFTSAYFAFFRLPAIQDAQFFFGYPLVGIAILFLLPDLFLKKDWSLHRSWRLPLRLFGGFFTLVASFALIFLAANANGPVAVLYFILALFGAAYALAYKRPYLAYLPILHFVLAVIYALATFNINLWRPVLAALAIAYYLLGFVLRSKQKWSAALRYSGLALGMLVTLVAVFLLQESAGWLALGGPLGSYLSLALGIIWYAVLIVIGLLFMVEMHLSRRSVFEFGALIVFSSVISLLIYDFNVVKAAYRLLAYSLLWLLEDLFSHYTYRHGRPLRILIHVAGGFAVLSNYWLAFVESQPWVSVAIVGVYTLLFLTLSLLYRQPKLLYAFTLAFSLFVGFFFRAVDVTRWIHPLIVTAIFYYAAGALLRALKRAPGWEQPLLYSGIGLGLIVSAAALSMGGADAALPVAIAATFWAGEALYRRNAWLALPANLLYLSAYFTVLFDLRVSEPQFFSAGVALFGLIQHYLLVRAKSRPGAFLIGMVSQLSLLGTTYIEMIAKGDLTYFFVLFVQSLIILIYGIVIRSRSLTLFPIAFVVLGVVTTVYSAIKDTGAIILIGCTGILLLILGVGAVLLRERIAKLSERLSDWNA